MGNKKKMRTIVQYIIPFPESVNINVRHSIAAALFIKVFVFMVQIIIQILI